METNSTSEPLSPSDVAAALKQEAARLGFDLAGIAPAVTPLGYHEFLAWLEQGYAGRMQYLPDRREAYRHPDSVLSGVKSIMMLGMNYKSTDPVPLESGYGRVSRYAWGNEDYHDFVRRRLNELGAGFERILPGHRWRGVIDTAPLLERDFARLAGLGWFGKNTMLIDKRKGSWLFLSALLLDVELPADRPFEADHCGTCTRCLDVCPTDAFPKPYVLDARKCISYLTIELHDQPIPADLRNGIGEWLFGCDLCQDVCPWNRKAPRSAEPTFHPVDTMSRIELQELLVITAHEFKQRFRHTPFYRTGWPALLRNAAIVLGNQRRVESAYALLKVLTHAEPLVRGASAWALGELDYSSGVATNFPEKPLLRVSEIVALLQKQLSVEQNGEVIEEIQRALGQLSMVSYSVRSTSAGEGQP
ncbi:MAG: tRNA epoxyqueuosine(34) reductase QueG [Planctomycetaceae bacterium]